MPDNFHLFRTHSNSQYVYDANTNAVHPAPDSLDEPFFERLYACETNDALRQMAAGQPELGHFIQYVIIWREKTDAFRNRPAYGITRLDDYEAAQNLHLNSGLPIDLVLITTESCNMRCSYCVYDEAVYSNFRTHNSAFMDWATAKKSIDYYFELNRDVRVMAFDKRALNIVFYGGESLLNWEVVRRSILYAREQYSGPSEMHIGISTNLTLFDLSWLPFLAENEVFLNISMDGPREEHDRFRRFAGGRPTFDIIYNKLKNINETDKDYFKRYVKALATYSQHSDLFKVADFFENAEYAPYMRSAASLRDDENSSFYEKYPCDRSKHLESIKALSARFARLCDEKKEFPDGSPYHTLLYSYWSSLFNEPHAFKYEKNWYTGACAPGRKLTVSPDGSLIFCEKVCAGQTVGHIDSGIDKEKVLRCYNDYFQAAEHCPSCWARCKCRLCPADACTEKGFQFSGKCDKTRRDISGVLTGLYSLLERNPDLFSREFAFF